MEQKEFWRKALLFGFGVWDFTKQKVEALVERWLNGVKSASKKALRLWNKSWQRLKRPIRLYSPRSKN